MLTLKSLKSLSSIALVLIVSASISACSSSGKKQRSLEDLAEQQVQDLYARGKKALDRGNYAFAIDYYRALEASYPYGELTEQAKLDMIFAFDKSGQAEKAVEMADNFISLYPTHKNVDYAYYMKGVANFEKKSGRFDRFIKGSGNSVRDPKTYRDSQDAFEELVKRYPSSVYSQDAKQRLIYIKNALAERELAVAQFYYDNATYVAALSRCKTIVYQYETTPAIEGALVLMEKTYAQMGMNDLAVSTREVLLENFPQNSSKPAKAKRKGFLSRLNPF